ncbi:ABC transporter ATP-binding protein [Flindersiella endophytica]
MRTGEAILEIRGLKTQFTTDDGLVRAVDGVDLDIRRGETLAVVGESGCGKSIMARSVLRLVDKPGRVVAGEVNVPAPPNGKAGANGLIDLLRADKRVVRGVRGKRIAMVFQEPMASLSLVHTVGSQIIEQVMLHEPMTKAQARQRAIELLGRVGIPAPERRIDAYPFQLSGGMRQRAVIAMALSCKPELLIADEPTTALDVTTQAQILELLKDLQREFGMAIMMITHDIGVAAQVADRIAVMYLGLVVESGDVVTILRSPKHPYTQALLRSVPKLGSRDRLQPVRGMVPAPFDRPEGCPFHPRCDEFIAGRCDVALPRMLTPADGHEVRCVLYEGVGQ